ncbi:MerR family transcriptional regulator [Streptomyces sp. 4N509B]|uniref:MerR family transcriptional regulator n=1 Tax=Streptomyces sp. 4N509B TaxID=3457413 RepID=UPI003FD42D3B
MAHTVGQLARIAGVSVRTLHHYDAIGLLVPGERGPAGHRGYGEAEVERLQQILFYRELGFPLEEIATLLDDPAADPLAHLRRQHGLLTGRIARLRAMVASVERAMEARTMGITLTPEERFEVFGDFDPGQHGEEIQRRWGDTDAYRESRRRTAAYGKEDWLRIRRESDELTDRFAALLDSGAGPETEAAMDLAEEHRQHVCRYFYTCSHEVHAGVGELFVNDERFAAPYEAVRPGLAAYVRDAVVANAARADA